jgi:hypothetical protein
MPQAAAPLHSRARPAARTEARPLPQVCRIAEFSGMILVGNVEQRLERFDRGWMVMLAADYEDGEKPKCFGWKVYPTKQTEAEAIELIRRRASDYGFVRIGILHIDPPAE